MADAAKESGRSLHAEIVSRLQASFQPQGGTDERGPYDLAKRGMDLFNYKPDEIVAALARIERGLAVISESGVVLEKRYKTESKKTKPPG